MKPFRYAESAGARVAACARLAASVATIRDSITAITRIPLNCIECSPQVCHEIVGILDADGNPDQTVRDAETVARLLGHAGVGGAGRVRNQRLGAPQTDRQLD